MVVAGLAGLEEKVGFMREVNEEKTEIGVKWGESVNKELGVLKVEFRPR